MPRLPTLALFLLLGVLYGSASADSDPNSKLKKCCSKLLDKGDDKECVERFCDFDAISQANVRKNATFKCVNVDELCMCIDEFRTKFKIDFKN